MGTAPTPEPQEEVPRRYLRPRRQATALPAPVAQPRMAVVDPVRLEMEPVDEDPERPGSAIVAWEAPDGTLRVVGGFSRANLMRSLGSEGAPFEVPAQLLRSADGVTLEQAQQLGPEIANAAGGSVVDVAASLRGLPIDRLLSRVPLTDRRTRQALALAMLDADSFAMVESGSVAPEHAAWIGILADGDPDLQMRLAESFAATPPATVFEAEVRVRRRALESRGDHGRANPGAIEGRHAGRSVRARAAPSRSRTATPRRRRA